MSPRLLGLCSLCLLATWPADRVFAQVTERSSSAASVFLSADRDGDKSLSNAEYNALRGDSKEVLRDWIVFDLNADQTLSEAEFLTIPSVGRAARGPIPDPFALMIERLLDSVKKQAVEKTTETEQLEFNPRVFEQALSGGIDKQPLHGVADLDGDGIVSLAEARSFLEVQIGIRRPDQELLRFPDGRVVNHHLFQFADANSNGKLERAEFIERSYGGAQVAAEFEKADVDKNAIVDLIEWCSLGGRCVIDPVLEFLRLDTDLDGFVSADEHSKGTIEWKRPLSNFMFPAFDTNKDGKFSLNEYRQTPCVNEVAHWYDPLNDQDGNEKLSFAEFQFSNSTCPLLRRIYFGRFDRDSSGQLESTEYPFRIRQHDVFYVMNEDGTDWKKLFEFEGHYACGSPAVSPDGKQLAFDSWIGANQGGSALYVMDINGGEPRQICPGMMPSWSGNGETLGFSNGSQSYSIWLTSLDGETQEGLARGWGGQISPDGKRIAYRLNGIEAMEIISGDVVPLLQGEANPYQAIYWNSAWSPDGRRLCFKGFKSDGTSEVASISTSGEDPDLSVHFSGKININADFAWHPKGDRIIFAMSCPERGFVQLYEFDPGKADPPKLVEGQDITRNNTDACWTPDGKRLIVISGDF
jgi:TolB protein